MQADAEAAGLREEDDHLDSWKEIAAYLRRDVTTVQRWERREGLPVHRLVHARQGSVYGSKRELDAWLQSRDGGGDVGKHDATTAASLLAQPNTPAEVASELPAWRRLPTAGRALLIVALATLPLTLLFWRDSARPATEGAMPTASQSDAGPAGSIAIAAFENRTGDPSLDGIGRLAAERVIRAVSQGTQVEVLARPVEAAWTRDDTERHSVSILVTGAYYRRAADLEFQVKVLDAASGRLLHGLAPVVQPPSRTGPALDEVEQKVAGAIAIQFDDFFGGLDVVAHPPSLDAYREYRAGLEVFQSDYRRCLTHLQRALELDPDFLLPRVIMEFAYVNVGQVDDAERVVREMEIRADHSTPPERLWIEFARALLENRRPQALRLLLDLEQAVPSSLLVNFNLIQQAVALNRPALAVRTRDKIPSFRRSVRHSIGIYRTMFVTEALHMLGAYDRELEEARRGQEYAPGIQLFLQAEARALAAQSRIADVLGVIERSLATGTTAGGTGSGNAGRVMEEAAVELRTHGQRDASLQVAARAVAWFESRPADIAASRRHQEALASVLYLAERWADSRRIFSALLAESPGTLNYLGHLGQLAAREGNVVEARAISEQLSRLPTAGVLGRQDRAWAMFERARIAALLGEPQRAVDLLRDALTDGFPVNLNIHENPDFELLRGYAPFIALTRPAD